MRRYRAPYVVWKSPFTGHWLRARRYSFRLNVIASFPTWAEAMGLPVVEEPCS